MRSTVLKRLLASFAVLALVLAQPTHAGFRPSFSLDICAWDATHIVVVAVTPDDDVFSVIQSLKGDLRIGESVTVPELRSDVDTVPISRYPQSQAFERTDEQGVSGRIPRQPIGSQIVLFLKQVQGKNAPYQETNLQDRRQWKPASLYGGMKVSVVWIDGGAPILLSTTSESRTEQLRTVPAMGATGLACIDWAHERHRANPR